MFKWRIFFSFPVVGVFSSSSVWLCVKARSFATNLIIKLTIDIRVSRTTTTTTTEQMGVEMINVAD